MFAGGLECILIATSRGLSIPFYLIRNFYYLAKQRCIMKIMTSEFLNFEKKDHVAEFVTHSLRDNICKTMAVSKVLQCNIVRMVDFV